MVENRTSQPKRKVISISEYIEMAKTSGDPLSFNPADIIRDAEHFRANIPLFDEDKFDSKLQELHGRLENGSKVDFGDKVKGLQDEIASKELQIKDLERVRDESLDVLRGFVGKELADRIKDLPDSIRKLVAYAQAQAGSYKAMQARLKSAEDDEKSRLQVSQDAVNSFFLSFNHIADPAEEKEAYRMLGQPVERMLSVDGAEKVSNPEEIVKFIINDGQLANAVLAKVAKNYDYLFSSASAKATGLKSSVDLLIQELEKRGLSQKDIDVLLKKAEATAMNKPMELRRQVDETVEKMSKEELAIKYNQLKQELVQVVKDKTVIEEQKKAMESRRADVHALLKELTEIDGILEQSEFYTSNPMSALGFSSSKIIESIPEELRKRKNALADIVAESLKLQKLVDEKERLITENSKMISAQKEELQKRKVLFVPDPVLKSIFSRFVLAYDVNNKYAAANNLPPEVLKGFSVKSEEGVQVLLDNYLSVLAKMRDSVMVDIVSAENQVWNKYVNIKPDADLKSKKDVHLLRKFVSSLISAEAGRVARNIQSVKSMLDSIHIPLEQLLETTGCTNLDAACLSSYVTPLYEQIVEIGAIPEKQSKLASKYGFASYSELKSKMDSELSFNDIKKIASQVDKSVRTKKEAAAFQRRLKSEVSSLDYSKIDSSKESIVKDFIVPNLSYDAIKLWATEVYNRLPAISNGSEEKTRLAKMVKGKRSFGSSLEYLKGFVNDPGFAKIDADLAYFVPAKKIFGDFNSGTELHNLLCDEIRKVEAYKSVRQSFK